MFRSGICNFIFKSNLRQSVNQTRYAAFSLVAWEQTANGCRPKYSSKPRPQRLGFFLSLQGNEKKISSYNQIFTCGLESGRGMAFRTRPKRALPAMLDVHCITLKQRMSTLWHVVRRYRWYAKKSYTAHVPKVVCGCHWRRIKETRLISANN